MVEVQIRVRGRQSPHGEDTPTSYETTQAIGEIVGFKN